MLGKHPRTIQRWCQEGKLPGCYKAGRSWRIPRGTLRQAGLGNALEPDKTAAKLKAAHALTESLRAEFEESRRRKQPSRIADDGHEIATQARRLEASAKRLAELAQAAHENLESRSRRPS